MIIITTNNSRVITMDEKEYPIIIDVVIRETNKFPEQKKYVITQTENGKLKLDLYEKK